MNSFYEKNKGEYQISTDPNKLKVEVIHNYLSKESYWAKDISLETVQASIQHSLCFGLYNRNKQIGFARLITDKTTFAYQADVFILENEIGKGLSKFLISAILLHPELQNLRAWMLGTKDAHTLYEKFGWVGFTEEHSKKYMIRTKNTIQKKSNKD